MEPGDAQLFESVVNILCNLECYYNVLILNMFWSLQQTLLKTWNDVILLMPQKRLSIERTKYVYIVYYMKIKTLCITWKSSMHSFIIHLSSSIVVHGLHCWLYLVLILNIWNCRESFHICTIHNLNGRKLIRVPCTRILIHEDHFSSHTVTWPQLMFNIDLLLMSR